MAATDSEETGSVMCLKNKGGENHFAHTLRQKHMHTHTALPVSIFLPSIAVQRQHLRTLCYKATVTLAPKGILSFLFKASHCSKKSTGMLIPLWRFEEKYKQANPPYLTHCIYPTVAERVKKKKRKKKKDRQRAKGSGRVL